MMSKSWLQGEDPHVSGGHWLASVLWVAVGLALATMPVWGVFGANLIRGDGRLSPTVLCDPKKEECILIENLEIYLNVPSPGDPVVGTALVWVDGKLSHCKSGACPHWTTGEYSEVGQHQTADDYLKLVGCTAGMGDGEEFQQIIQEWATTTSPEQRLALAPTLKGRA